MIAPARLVLVLYAVGIVSAIVMTVPTPDAITILSGLLAIWCLGLAFAIDLFREFVL